MFNDQMSSAEITAAQSEAEQAAMAEAKTTETTREALARLLKEQDAARRGRHLKIAEALHAFAGGLAEQMQALNAAGDRKGAEALALAVRGLALARNELER